MWCSSSKELLVGVVVVVVLALGPALAAALPTCSADDEDCRDRLMHPQLRDDRIPRPRLVNGEDTNEFWRQQAKHFVRSQMQIRPNEGRAKNVILFLGDGMGLTTISATRNVLGGEEKQLSFEDFPFVGLAKTYSVNKIVPDSACTATAYLCGVKAQQGTIGLSGHVDKTDCVGGKDPRNFVYSIAKWAMDAGKWAGVLTTTRITHASPAGAYAHIADRQWEDDALVSADCGPHSGVQDIALQLIDGDVGSKLRFVMGGGRKHFVDGRFYENGTRKDGRNLIDEWRKRSARNLYVETRDELMRADLGAAERVFGLYQDSHMLYHLETDENATQPTLEEMTRKAIEFLGRSPEGYFIFIEGGRIDLAHHDTMARIALDETVEFSKAIAAARQLTSDHDTLIVVTADHSHAFSQSGYPYRGADIFGTAPATPADRKPYMTLSYANGPSYSRFFDNATNERIDPTSVIKGEPHDPFPAMAPLEMETHGGDDVAVYASGPWSHLFTGVYEQNAIPHMMAFASCLGDGLTMCTENLSLHQNN